LNTKNKTIIFYITDNGFKLAQRLTALFPEAETIRFKSGELTKIWHSTGKVVFIMATGIVVRAVAPLLKDKRTDPAIVVLDEKGSYVISLLSGHIGGANELAGEIAGYLGAEAVITTASDIQGKLALDLWAMEKDLYIEDTEKLKKISAKIVNGKRINLKVEYSLNNAQIPKEFTIVDSAEEADVIISHRDMNQDALFLRPKTLVAGIGCNRGTAKAEIEEAIKTALRRENLSFHSLRNLATIDIKKDEKGLLEFAGVNGLDIDFFTKDELNSAAIAHNIKGSKEVEAATGAVAVAGPAAVLSAKKGSNGFTILTSKEKRGNVTLALAKAEFTL